MVETNRASVSMFTALYYQSKMLGLAGKILQSLFVYISKSELLLEDKRLEYHFSKKENLKDLIF